jgi:phosphoglucomutase
MICGEESFGTGSNHVREKDGMWAVLAWLSILAHYNTDPSAPFLHVETIVKKHWLTYGRNFYVRYDYEGVEKANATALMTNMIESFGSLVGQVFLDGKYQIESADEFEYLDPIDGSVSSNQGIRILFVGGSRIIFRLSGTAGSGATIRMYLEKYEDDAKKLMIPVREALDEMVTIALKISQMTEITGMDAPTVIT